MLVEENNMNTVNQYPYFTNREQKERIVMMVGRELLRDIDELGLSQGFNSRSATLRHLIKTGLKEFKQQKATENPQGS